MRTLALITTLVLLSACGVESAGTAATVGKLQAEQAKQGKEQMEKFKTDLDAANKASAESLKKAEEANRN